MASDSGSGQNDSAFYKWWSGYNEPFPRPKTTAKAAWFAALASAPAHSSGNGQAFKAGDEVWVRGKLVAPANEHGRIEVVCDSDEQFYVNVHDALASAPAVDRAGEAVLPSDRERAMLFYGYPIDATAIAMTAMANILRLAEQFAQVRSHSRAGALEEALKEIVEVASGEKRVANDDTEGMEWVDKRARRALAHQPAESPAPASDPYDSFEEKTVESVAAYQRSKQPPACNCPARWAPPPHREPCPLAYAKPAPADAGKELRALSAKWHGPIGDGGKGWADEDKIYWCREVRNQYAEELDAVLASLRVKVEELWNAHAGDGWSGDAVCVDERFKDTVLALLGEGEKHAPI